MNIKVVNDFSDEKIYSAFDNIIIEFALDQEPSSPISFAEILGLNVSITLSANPEGVFYFNYKMFSKSYITKDKLQENIDYNIEQNNALSFSKKDDSFIDGKAITIKIVLADEREITKDFSLKYNRAIKDLDRFNDYFFIDQELGAEYNAEMIYFFPGYPFDLGIFTKELQQIGIQTEENRNSSNSVSIQTFDYVENYQFTRLVLSNGFSNLKSSNGNDLTENISEIYIADFSENDFVVKTHDVKQMPNCEGHYLKWLNRSGDFSYFLFSNRYEENIDVNSLGNINNDYKNKEYSISPKLSKGKESTRELTLFKDRVDEQMRYHLSDLVDSPRVYYYTGEKDQEASVFDWIEVEITNSNFEMHRPKDNVFDFYFDIEFPDYKNQRI